MKFILVLSLAILVSTVLSKHHSPLRRRLSGENYAIIANGSHQTITFEGCPTSTLAQTTLGCKTFTATTAHYMIISKPHGLITDSNILVKINGNPFTTIQEGKLYRYYPNGQLTQIGTVDDYKRSNAIIQ